MRIVWMRTTAVGVALCAAILADGVGGSLAAQARPFVRIDPASADSSWTVRWLFPRPVEVLRLTRPSAFFRERAWQVVTPGYELARDGNDQVIRRTVGGGASAEIAIRTIVFTETLPKEYEAFQRLSDGGVAVYTGQFLAKAEGPGLAADEVRDFVIAAGDETRTVIGGQVHSGPVRWRDATGAGTYIYVGATDPVESPNMVAIVDRGLPQWIRDMSADALPSLFALYAEGTGLAVEERPFVLLGWIPSESPGLSSGGGVLPNLIQLGLEGRAWATPSNEARVHLLAFIAHEAAHVWNGNAIHSRDPAEAWMHEGGADAFADRALLMLDVIDQAQFDERQTRALNECLSSLHGQPLRASATRGTTRDYYTCGNVLALWTEAALARAGAGVDLFGFWGRLAGLARRREDRGYDQADYLAILDTLGVPPDAVAHIAALTDEEHGDTGVYLADLLRSVGITVAIDPAEDDDYRRAAGQAAFGAVMRADCNGGMSFYNSTDHVEIAAGPTCSVLRPGMRVATVEGEALFARGSDVYDRVRARCSAGESVRVGLTNGSEFSVRCTTAPPVRTPFYRVTTGG